MKSRIPRLFALLIALTFNACESSAAEVPTAVLRFNGRFASAEFGSHDSSYCVLTDADVFVETGVAIYVSHDSGVQTSHDPWLFLRITADDVCAGTNSLDAFYSGSIPSSAITIDPLLNAASLKTTVLTHEFVSSHSLPILLNVTWKGSGPLLRIPVNVNFKQFGPPGGSRVVFHISGSQRVNDASGTVSDGTTNFAAGGEIEPSDLGSTREGEVDFYIKH